MDKKEMKDLIREVKRNLRITKVVVTRSVKTKQGDFFIGYAAGWDTVQDDAGGPGADMDLTTEAAEVAGNGMTLAAAKVARCVVALEVDTAAYENAFVNGALTRSDVESAKAAIKNNYAKLIQDALVGGNGNGNGGEDKDKG